MAVASFSAVAGGTHAAEAGAFTFEATYTADLIGPLRGGAARSGRVLDNLDLIADLDLEKAVGWSGATLHGYVLNNSGGQPNAVVGTLEGVDNIEVSRARTRLYELWLQQAFAGGRASLRAGLYDLNSEFYVTEAADLFLAPPFGIGSEFAATGPNGPSIFPSTTLAVRLRYGAETGPYAQAAILNADVRTLGDPDGPDLKFDEGALVVAEAGYAGRFALGAWRYTRRQDDLRDLAPDGTPVRRRAAGAYVSLEHALIEDAEGAAVRGFVRGGISDGDTTPFEGGWQAGVLVERLLSSRPDSALALGVSQGRVSSKHRDNGADAGLDLGRAESRIEITYSDRIGSRLTLQPDLQYIRRPGADRDARDALVAGLRVTLALN